MFGFFETLPQVVRSAIAISMIACGSGIAIAVIYRLVKYGIKLKAGPVEIDASEENPPEVKK